MFGIEQEVDFIACSFVSRKQDLEDVHAFLKEQGNPDIELIAKIENQPGIDNIEEILKNNNKILKLQADLENKLSKIKSKLSSQDTYIDKIYKDKLKGIIDEDMFLRQYNLLTQEKSKMKDEKIIDISLKERIRLDKSYINYHDIIDKNLPYKFAYLD